MDITEPLIQATVIPMLNLIDNNNNNVSADAQPPQFTTYELPPTPTLLTPDLPEVRPLPPPNVVPQAYPLPSSAVQPRNTRPRVSFQDQTAAIPDILYGPTTTDRLTVHCNSFLLL